MLLGFSPSKGLSSTLGSTAWNGRPKRAKSSLRRGELERFLTHSMDKDAAARFEPSALDAIFEQGRGLPALLTACAEECLTAQPKGPISAEQVAAVLDRIAAT